MTMEPLQRIRPPPDKFPAAGHSPRLDYLPLASLVVNTSYQRQITRSGEKTIERIMSGFSWSRFSPVIVREQPGSSLFEIIDGQHRSTAALCLGYERVPCMIVKAGEDEAARIFAEVNGNVAPMTQVAIYKAALAGGEEWALAVRRAAGKAGAAVLTSSVPRGRQKPLQTIAVSACRRLLAAAGEDVLAATFRLLASSVAAPEPGFLSHTLISRWGQVLASRPDWVRSISAVCSALAEMRIDLRVIDVAAAEQRLVKRFGDGRPNDDGGAIEAKVIDMRRRNLSPQMIAASLRMPYAEVDRILRGAK